MGILYAFDVMFKNIPTYIDKNNKIYELEGSYQKMISLLLDAM